MNPTDTSSVTMRVRTPEDLLALVPVILGFMPEESVTMLTFGRRRMHARVDLPTDPEHLPVIVQALLCPCRQHQVERVAFVVHAKEPELAGLLMPLLLRGFEGEGIAVMAALRADGQRWFPLDCADHLDDHCDGVPYDVAAHPFVAQAILRGEVLFTSREQLAQSLDPNPTRVRAVGRLMEPDGTGAGDCENQRVLALLESWGRADIGHCGAGPSDSDIATLLVALRCPKVRDAAWLTLTRDRAQQQVSLWTQVLVSAPAEFRAAPAGLLAFAAWLAGNGALAWCAVDLVEETEHDQTMAAVVRAALEHAVPPSAWDRGRFT